MTFGRWILIHSLSISILVMLGVGYFYKQELRLEEAYSQLLLIDSSSISVTKTKPSQEIETSVNKDSQGQRTQSVVAIKEELSTLMPSSKGSMAGNNKSFEIASKEAFSSIDQKKSGNREAPIQGDYLLQARKAYWDKNYQQAIQLYKKEIDKSPDTADLYGELGNIYYTLENYNVASSYYLNAGELFLKMDDQFRAKQIYDILISMAPKKAQLLLELKNESHQ